MDTGDHHGPNQHHRRHRCPGCTGLLSLKTSDDDVSTRQLSAWFPRLRLTAAPGFGETSTHFYAFAAIEGKTLAVCLDIRLRGFVTPYGIGDHLISKHKIPVAGCALLATDRGVAGVAKEVLSHGRTREARVLFATYLDTKTGFIAMICEPVLHQ